MLRSKDAHKTVGFNKLFMDALNLASW